MLHNKIYFKNPRTEEVKVAPIGFSWSILCFDFFVPLYRKDFLWALIMLGAGIVSYGVSGIFFAFVYNKLYAKSLVKKGFKIYHVEGCVPQHIANRILDIPSLAKAPSSQDLLDKEAK